MKPVGQILTLIFVILTSMASVDAQSLKDLTGQWGEASDLKKGNYTLEIYKSASGNWRARGGRNGPYEYYYNNRRWQATETLESFEASPDRVLFVIKKYTKGLDHAQTSDQRETYSLSLSADGEVLSGSVEFIDHRNRGMGDTEDVVKWTSSVILNRF